MNQTSYFTYTLYSLFTHFEFQKHFKILRTHLHTPGSKLGVVEVFFYLSFFLFNFFISFLFYKHTFYIFSYMSFNWEDSRLRNLLKNYVKSKYENSSTVTPNSSFIVCEFLQKVKCQVRGKRPDDTSVKMMCGELGERSQLVWSYLLSEIENS